MKRRCFLMNGIAFVATQTSAAQSDTSPSLAQTFNTEFQMYMQDVDAIFEARSARELQYRDGALTEAQTSMSGRRSERTIDPLARELIVTSEVTSRRRYELDYKHPTWPGEDSGVTIGIGYDLGYVKPATFADHWDGILASEKIERLKSVCRLKGDRAGDAVASVTDVTIDWPQAEQQFDRFLPYVVAETEDNYPYCDGLNGKSLGALVSIIYNRGSKASISDPRRAEMFAIKQLMLKREYKAVPEQIRKMKRLWFGRPKARGLLARRELEAILFEEGTS